jgi:hypothetical protein
MGSMCVECGCEMRRFDRGWRLVRIADPESESDDVLAAYCPVCAERELDDASDELDPGQIVGGVQVSRFSRMEFVVDFDSEDADLVVTTSGPADVGGFRQFSRAMIGDARFRPTMSILVDHSALDTSSLADGELEEIHASALSVRERLAAARIAVVVSDLGEAVSAQRLGEHGQVLSPTSRAFQSRAEAAGWLRSATGTRARNEA